MNYLVSFWIGFGQLLIRPNTATNTIDLPLQAGVVRARWHAAWTAVLTALCLWYVRVYQHHHALPIHPQHWNPVVTIVLNLLAAILWIPVFYGVFRLYILISHVITLNVFKTRGQRLRLLNLQTSLLPLSVPLILGVALLNGNNYRILGLVVILAVSIEIIWVFGQGYNQIFHKRKLQGLLLWLEATLVTWFVLAIGALAVAVTIGVLGFFAVLFLRIFQ